jgi:hypothetical protein
VARPTKKKPEDRQRRNKPKVVDIREYKDLKIPEPPEQLLDGSLRWWRTGDQGAAAELEGGRRGVSATCGHVQLRGADREAGMSTASPPPRVTQHHPDRERRSASDALEAAADLVRPATLDPHTAPDIVLDAAAHNCVPNDSFSYVCEVQLEQREGRRV